MKSIFVRIWWIKSTWVHWKRKPKQRTWPLCRWKSVDRKKWSMSKTEIRCCNVISQGAHETTWSQMEFAASSSAEMRILEEKNEMTEPQIQKTESESTAILAHVEANAAHKPAQTASPWPIIIKWMNYMYSAKPNMSKWASMSIDLSNQKFIQIIMMKPPKARHQVSYSCHLPLTNLTNIEDPYDFTCIITYIDSLCCT